jgi:hypothetical protein
MVQPFAGSVRIHKVSIVALGWLCPLKADANVGQKEDKGGEDKASARVKNQPTPNSKCVLGRTQTATVQPRRGRVGSASRWKRKAKGAKGMLFATKRDGKGKEGKGRR